MLSCKSIVQSLKGLFTSLLFFFLNTKWTTAFYQVSPQ